MLDTFPLRQSIRQSKWCQRGMGGSDKFTDRDLDMYACVDVRQGASRYVDERTEEDDGLGERRSEIVVSAMNDALTGNH